MTQPDHADHGDAAGLLPALAVWLAVQLIALALGAMQVPLSARYPEPAERLAVHVLLVVQVVAAAMLFPILLRGWRTTAVVIVTAWPMIQLAGYLSTRPAGQLMLAGAYLSLWLITLSIWRSVLQTRLSQMLGVALATALALGGPVIWYLAMEFGVDRPEIDWAWHGALGPLLGALAQLEQPRWHYLPWLLLLLLLCVGLVVQFIKRRPKRAKRDSSV